MCKLLKGMVTPSPENLHFVYSWHVGRLPPAWLLRHGICKHALESYKTAWARTGYLDDPIEPGMRMPSLASEGERSRAAARLMRDAKVLSLIHI